ncbi:hypothetical protein QR680_006622 [Steinernema hermaphroditum]|uniref:Uncharacterized protein n=1 Tax=Steinernema hermaphroditum TaxID=289476 RepID=A0AA39HXH7_9BILA|nr:hypothetical protein QR680_006622 [Steinernema hermaphroditum]
MAPHPFPQEPDMNAVVYQGVRKMLLVADDMHRMTGYIRDLRNMTVLLGLISIVGGLIFLFVFFKSDRRTTSRRVQSELI